MFVPQTYPRPTSVSLCPAVQAPIPRCLLFRIDLIPPGHPHLDLSQARILAIAPDLADDPPVAVVFSPINHHFLAKAKGRQMSFSGRAKRLVLLRGINTY